MPSKIEKEIHRLKKHWLDEFPPGSRVYRSLGATKLRGTVENVSVEADPSRHGIINTLITVKLDDGQVGEMLPISINPLHEQRHLFSALRPIYASGYAAQAAAYLRQHGRATTRTAKWAARHGLDARMLKEAIRLVARHLRIKKGALDLGQLLDLHDELKNDIQMAFEFTPHRRRVVLERIIDELGSLKQGLARYSGESALIQTYLDAAGKHIQKAQKEFYERDATPLEWADAALQNLHEVLRLLGHGTREYMPEAFSEVSSKQAAEDDDPCYNPELRGSWGTAPENRGIWKGQPFWSGVADVKTGEIVEVHTYEEAECVDFNDFYLSDEAMSMTHSQAGPPEGVFFWIGEDGKIETQYEVPTGKGGREWQDIQNRVVKRIERQIKIVPQGGQSDLFKSASKMCECGHPMDIHSHPPDFGCPHEKDGCGCKGATEKTAANPNLTVRNWRRKNPWPKEMRQELPISGFTEWIAEQARQGVRFNSIEEAQKAYKEKTAGPVRRALLPAALLGLGLAAPTTSPAGGNVPAPPPHVEQQTPRQVTLEEFAKAVAREEGADPSFHNPGNLIGFHSGEILRFPTERAGMNALKHQLVRIFRGENPKFDPGMSLQEMGLVYSDGDPNWAKNVSQILHVSPETPISKLVRLPGKQASSPAIDALRQIAELPSDKTTSQIEGVIISSARFALGKKGLTEARARKKLKDFLMWDEPRFVSNKNTEHIFGIVRKALGQEKQAADHIPDAYCDSCDRPESECICEDCALKKTSAKAGYCPHGIKLERVKGCPVCSDPSLAEEPAEEQYLYHGSPQSKAEQILEGGIVNAPSHWGVEGIASIYARDDGIVFRVPLSRFDQSKLRPDMNAIKDPIRGEDVDAKDEIGAKQFERSAKKSWQDSLDLAGAVVYRAPMKVTEADIVKHVPKQAGAWDVGSYDNDSVHDILDRHRTKPPEGMGFEQPVSPGQAEKLLKEMDGFGEAMSTPDDYARYFGTMVFLSTHGTDIGPYRKNLALEVGQSLAEDEDYLKLWKNPLLRKAKIEEELGLFRKAASHGIEKAHAASLLKEAFGRHPEDFEGDTIQEQVDSLMEQRAFTKDGSGDGWAAYSRNTEYEGEGIWLKVFFKDGEVTKVDMFDEEPENVIGTRKGFEGLFSFAQAYGD